MKFNSKSLEKYKSIRIRMDAYAETISPHWAISNRYRPRFFDQVGHETMYASSRNKHFFTKSCHRQTYQNYEQSRQKLGTIIENKVS